MGVMELDFDDLAPREEPIKIRGKRYVLREASAEAARKWRNSILSGTKVVNGRVVGVGNVADSEAILVSLCLFPVQEDGQVAPKPVPIATILSWPNRLVRPLFTKAQAMSDLDEKETPDTVESLRAAIAPLQERLDKLVQEGASEEEDPTSVDAVSMPRT